MGIRFNKSIKINDYLKINISKSGISATVGKKGASINVGGKGTYLNLSPTVAGIKGTGVSYRQKIGGNLVGGLINKVTGKDNKEEAVEKEPKVKEEKEVKQISEKVDDSVVVEYNQELEGIINIHKYADKVMNKEEFANKVNELESEAVKSLYELSIKGDENTIEDLVGNVLNNLELAYSAKANYELEDTILYVDLDLPEIEDLKQEYPVLEKGKVVNKKKSNNELKEEYGKMVLSLGVYLAAQFFNTSSYIEQIVMSAFTSIRDNNGDLVDNYLYSVKYNRNVFENSDLSSVDSVYSFLLQFENRINMTNTYTFKAIKPYEMASVTKANSLIDDAVLGLKELGYKQADINNIMPKLLEAKFETSGEYLKYALSIIKQ